MRSRWSQSSPSLDDHVEIDATEDKLDLVDDDSFTEHFAPIPDEELVVVPAEIELPRDQDASDRKPGFFRRFFGIK